jgi:hypothetical protein
VREADVASLTGEFPTNETWGSEAEVREADVASLTGEFPTDETWGSEAEVREADVASLTGEFPTDETWGQRPRCGVVATTNAAGGRSEVRSTER